MEAVPSDDTPGALPGAPRLRALPALQRRLNNAPTLGALLARAAVEACSFCGFERGVVLGVDAGHLTATATDTVEDPACDALRRRCLADPVPLTPGSEEADLIRRAEAGKGARPSAASALRDALDLEEYVVAPVVPESRVVAVLVLDRGAPAVAEEERSAVDLFAHLLGLAVERVVLRLRMQELASELRHLTASAHALMTEALEAPVGLTTDYGHGPVFTEAGQFGGISSDLNELLSPREREIAALMVSGRSNREIGEELHLSPDTVKTHVARLVHKLGASNRVEAVARYVSMARDRDA